MANRNPQGSNVGPEKPLFSLPQLAAITLLIVVFAVLATFAAGPGSIAADVRIAQWVQSAPLPAARQIARLGSWIGSFTVLAPLSLLTLIWLMWRRWIYDAAFLAMAGVLHSTNSMLKWLIDSPRPPAQLVEVLAHANGKGFPSGHATGSTLIFGAFAVIAARHIEHPWRRRGAVAFCLVLIVIVGFARVKEGVHWPSDVLGGYLWGLAMLLVASAIIRIIAAKRRV